MEKSDDRGQFFVDQKGHLMMKEKRSAWISVLWYNIDDSICVQGTIRTFIDAATSSGENFAVFCVEVCCPCKQMLPGSKGQKPIQGENPAFQDILL